MSGDILDRKKVFSGFKISVLKSHYFGFWSRSWNAILDFFAKGSIHYFNQTIGKFLLKIGLKKLFGDILDIK